MSTSLHSTPGGDRQGFAGIARVLRRAIIGGELGPGAQLASISELARRHGTTAITVRRALRALEQEGLVRVEHGVGTFVADWGRQYDMLHLAGFSTEMAARRVSVETRLCGSPGREPHPEAAAALDLERGAAPAMLARLRLVGGEPAVFQRSYVDPDLGAVLEACTPDRSLYELLSARGGRAPFAADETARALLLEAPEAGLLGCAPGAPGWAAFRVTSDAEGRPLVYDEAYFRADRVELSMRRQAGRSLLEYRILVPGAAAGPVDPPREGTADSRKESSQ